MMTTRDQALDRLDAMRKLTDDWDGFGSPAPDESAIARALQFMRSWDGPTPAASPAPGAEVEFEWEAGELVVLLQFRPKGAVRLHAFDSERTLVEVETDRKSTRLNSSHCEASRMPSSA